MNENEALQIIGILWGQRKRSNLNNPALGGGDTWHDAILAAEEVVEDALRRVMTSPLVGSRINIVRRNAINDAVRKATRFAPFYSRELYVSTGLLEGAAQKIERGLSGLKALPARRFEHVIPLSVHGSGTRLIQDVSTELPMLRRALLGPTCLVTEEEDKLLKDRVKTHPRPLLPFLRYHRLVEVRRTNDGSIVEANTFTFRDHIRYMESMPGYATAVPLFGHGKRRWRRFLDEIGPINPRRLSLEDED
jgi:hypothetical protein